MLSISNYFKDSKNFIFLFILASNVVAALSFDVFFIAQKDIGEALNASYLQVGQIQGMWTFGLCVGQFALAPMTDNHGRKGVFIFGMIITCLSGFVCFYLSWFTGLINSLFGSVLGSFSEIEIMIMMRLIQGIGISTQILCSRIMINDIFSSKKEISKAFAMMTTAILTFAVIAPLLSGQMVEMWGWSSLFLLMSVVALFLLVTLFYIPETLDSKNKENSFTYLSYMSVFDNRQYIGYVLINAIMFIWIFATIFCMPIIVMDIFRYDPIIYSFFGSGMMILAILGSLSNQKLLNDYSIDKLILNGCLIMFCLNIALLFLSLFIGSDGNIVFFDMSASDIVSLSVICILVFAAKMFTGFIASNCITGSINCYPEKAGIASSVFGIAQFGISSSAFTFAGMLIDYGFSAISTMAVIQFTSITLCIILYFTLINNKKG